MDPVTAIGLAASIWQLIDLGTKLVERIGDFHKNINDVPDAFRTICRQIPLLNINLQRLLEQSKKGNVPEEVVRALTPVLVETQKQIGALDTRLAGIVPPEHASSLERGLKAVKSVAQESEVRRAAEKISDCMDILVFHQTTTNVGISHSILDEIRKLSVSPVPPSYSEESTLSVHDAVGKNDVQALRSMLSRGFSLHVIDAEGRTPLHIAASSDSSIKMVRVLCRNRANVNAEDFTGQTPLHRAVICQAYDVAVFLIEHGADKEIHDDDGRSPLSYAPQDILTQWKLQHGADPNARDPRNGNTALIHSAARGNVQVCAALLESGADVDARNNHESTALIIACTFGHLDVIRLLLDHGADTNALDADDYSAFNRTVWSNFPEATKLFLESGKADLEAEHTSNGHTPLAEAVKAQNWPMALILVEAGANVSVRVDTRYPLLSEAIMHCRNISVIETLLKAGADWAVQKDGWNAIQEAMYYERWDIMRLLIEYGASADAKDAYGYPLVARLAMTLSADVSHVEYLISKGANLDAENNDGWTALQEAVNNSGRPEIVHALLKGGADPNTRIKSEFYGLEAQSTALMHLASGMHPQQETHFLPSTSLKYLIDYGADIEAVDIRGWTALRYAVEFEQDRSACLLFLRGANPHAKAKDGKTPADRARTVEEEMSDFCSLLDTT